MGRPKKILTEDKELEGHEAAMQAIAQVLTERCGIPGCVPRVHYEEATFILKKFIRLGIVKDEQ